MNPNIEVYKALVHVGLALADGRNSYVREYSDALNLRSAVPMDLAFDQSTTQTGIALKIHGGPVVLIADFINKGLPSKEIYNVFLQEFVGSLVKNLNIKYVVYEDPVEHSRTITTRNVLLELRGLIKLFHAVIPELRESTFVEVPIPTWRKHFLADPIYQGRRQKKELVKYSTQEEALRRFPTFTSYSDRYKKPCDSMDAIGILEGWTSEYFTGSDMKQIRVNKCMTPINNLNHMCEIVKIRLDQYREFLQDRFGIMVKVRNYLVLMYNGDMTYKDQALRAASCFNEYCLIFVTSQKDTQAIRWVIGEDLNPGEIYAVLAYRNETTGKLPLNPRDDEEREFWLRQR